MILNMILGMVYHLKKYPQQSILIFWSDKFERFYSIESLIIF